MSARAVTSDGMGTRSIDNALSVYYDGVVEALDWATELRARDDGPSAFSPAFALPNPSSRLENYFQTSGIGIGVMGDYKGHELLLLDLMRNPMTQTTKTFGSLVIVGRALRHIEATGDPVMIITPSAANKATALRDAVHRAYNAGLASPDELRVAVVVPSTALPKLWHSSLAADQAARERNPVMVYDGDERETVKQITRDFMREHSETLRERHGFHFWDSLHVHNYMVADVVRAFTEHDVLEQAPGPRLHVHAVSSAYGFLGHALGRSLLERAGLQPTPAQYLFVQHLETPDVVLNVLHGRIDQADLPRFVADAPGGLLRQDSSRHFPTVTFDVAERLEPTFYTRNPPTLPAITELVGEAGGTGLVVSLKECLDRYHEARTLLKRAGLTLPADPRKIREWAMVMAVVGVLNAIDRGLIDNSEVVVHGSGLYSEGDFSPFSRHLTETVQSADDVVETLDRALRVAA